MGTATPPTNDEIAARYFGAGSDARLRGDPLSLCDAPDFILQRQWRRGWHHVDAHWGADCVFPVAELPPVKINGNGHARMDLASTLKEGA